MGGGARLAECELAVSLRGAMHVRDSGMGQQDEMLKELGIELARVRQWEKVEALRVLVTTPRGSSAKGFWNDSAVSSHGGSSVHTHTRVVAQ